MSRSRLRLGSLLAALVVASLSLVAAAPPKLLLVVAHPDDELIAAASIYRLAKERGATVDQFIVTNGEGGYRYSTLAEKVYGLELTKEEVGRRALPDIRKGESLAAGRILGVRAHYFLDEPDRNNTDDPKDIVGVWKTDALQQRLRDFIEREKYDVVMTGLPRPDLGGHHIAASLLAIRTVAALPATARPTLIGLHYTGDPFVAPAGSDAAGFSGAPDYDFDRTRKFGFNNALDYQAIANWVITEHKSQGLYQTNVNKISHEYIWVFNRADTASAARAKDLFALLAP